MKVPLPDKRPRSRALTAQYQRAFALCARPDGDLNTARSLLLACVQGDPSNLIFVETFLQVLRRAEPRRRGWQGIWDRMAFRRACRVENWHHVVERGLRLLVVTPADGPLLCGLGEAMEKLGHQNVALRYWSAAAQAHPDDPAVQRRLATAMSRMGLFEQAGHCWQRVVAQQPHDTAAREMLERFPCSPFPGAGSAGMTPDQSGPGGGTADEQDLLRESERLRRRGDLSAAITCLRNALLLSPGDLRIAERLEDMELEAAGHRVEIAREHAGVVTDDPLIADLQADLIRREIGVFAARSARYPQEHRWKLRLAKSLQQAGNFAEACRTLQTIPQGSVAPTQVHLLWGECLQYQHQFQEALAHYETAAENTLGAEALDADGHRALYRTGVLAAHLGDLSKAHEFLQRLVIDCPTYKDARQHLDKIDSIRDKDGFFHDSDAP